MRFAFDDEQEEIKRSARDLLARRAPLERVRAAAQERAYDEALWREIVELGWPGLAIGEAHGGVGLGLVELVAVLEQVGYALTPSPLVADVCAALVIDLAGRDEQRARWLPGIASGEQTATVARVRDGVAAAVPDAERAAAIVLVGDDGSARVVPAQEARVEPYDGIDLTRRWARVQVAAEAGEPLAGDVAGGLQRAEVALAAELTGLAQRALDMTVAYVKERKQFGRPVGAFQGVSHRCAEMLALTEAARSATYFAAWAADADRAQLPAASAMAKASAASAARRVAAMAIQAHGGIGFTWEADVHWIFKRAHASAAQLGSGDEHRRSVARLAAQRLRDAAAPSRVTA
ncbi:acyl-CoA dehydrogenase family protein [Conexibacter sp. CPCC 206217]|uniref:acyl-CoA dehydrogenase family protein n=1 Tax=Conexibacter sp. CPCC 206217 TaxID=3064574 RepID=UPI0027275E52|nr:acyl-CoA dehydrogenase family protein [Conexibacter sp. CPCC 206217]MDO8212236.1 acyl-CoA dehydrogenase family protein [Conexibacter sp. CPCC 206217]